MSKPIASNPRVLGEDPIPLLFEAGGLAGTHVLNERLLAPVIQGIIPGDGGIFGKMVDVASTGVTAYLLGEGVGMIDRAAGNRVKRGGMVLAGGKFLGAFIPGFSISGQFPIPAGFPSLGAPAPATTALPTGQQATVQNPVLSSLRSMGI